MYSNFLSCLKKCFHFSRLFLVGISPPHFYCWTVTQWAESWTSMPEALDSLSSTTQNWILWHTPIIPGPGEIEAGNSEIRNQFGLLRTLKIKNLVHLICLWCLKSPTSSLWQFLFKPGNLAICLQSVLMWFWVVVFAFALKSLSSPHTLFLQKLLDIDA